jgi:hypothetical protein
LKKSYLARTFSQSDAATPSSDSFNHARLNKGMKDFEEEKI